MSSSSNSRALGLLLLVGSFTSVVACDDPVKVEEEDNRVKANLSDGCRASGGSTLKGLQSQTPMVAKGLDRTYDWFIPDAHDGRTPVPVVFVFHGTGGSGASVRAEFKIEEATGGKAIVVYPDAIGSTKEWDLDRGGETNGDIIFFDQILESLSKDYCIDTNRVFAAGVSRGGYFANNMGCLRGGKLRAIASMSGGGPYSAEYSGSGELQCPQKPVAAIVMHGAADTTVEPAEGKKSRDHWSRVNGCRPGGLETFEPAPCINQLSCATDRPVVWCEIPDLGHSVWPEAPRAAWKFFDQL